MRNVKCPHCGHVVDESSQAWDLARASGACPDCGKMLDAGLEARASALADSEAITRRTRRLRRNALVLGILCCIGVLPPFLLGGPPGGGLLLGLAVGVPALLFALLYRPVDEARKDVKGRTDLDRLR